MTRTAAALLAALLLTACGGSDPDLAGCESRIREMFADAVVFDAEVERPAECDGASDRQLQEIAIRVINEAREQREAR